MQSFSTSTDLFSRIEKYLVQNLTWMDMEVLVPCGDPLRNWWQPTQDSLNLDKLIEVLKGANDYLSLLTIVYFADSKYTLPQCLRKEIPELFNHIAINSRRSSSDAFPFEVFLSYSHADKSRVNTIRSILENASINVFQDVEHIQPGESIVGVLDQVMKHIPRAILIISKNYMASEWTQKELDVFLTRKRNDSFSIFPVLIDEIELPDNLRDVFTIDLRGFRGEEDKEWGTIRLQKIIDVCLRRP